MFSESHVNVKSQLGQDLVPKWSHDSHASTILDFKISQKLTGLPFSKLKSPVRRLLSVGNCVGIFG